MKIQKIFLTTIIMLGLFLSPFSFLQIETNSAFAQETNNGFIWKPTSETTGKLVVLLPNSYKGQVQTACIFRGSTQVECGNFAGDEANGNRPHYRFKEHGSFYGSGIRLVMTLRSGQTVSWDITDGVLRCEASGSGPTTCETEEGSDTKPSIDLFDYLDEAGKACAASFLANQLTSFVSRKIASLTNKAIGLGANMAGTAIGAAVGGPVGGAIGGEVMGSLFGDEEELVKESVLRNKEATLDGIAFCLANAMIETVVKSTIDWIQKGAGLDGEERPFFIENLGAYQTEISDRIFEEAIDSISERSCLPWRQELEAALIIRQSGNSSLKSCGIRDVSEMTNFLAGDFSSGGWNSWFNLTQNNESNFFGQYLQATDALDRKIEKEISYAMTEANWGSGFMSAKETDPNTGISKVTTPGRIMLSTLENRLSLPTDRLKIADEFDEVLSATLTHFINKGLDSVFSNNSSDSYTRFYDQQRAIRFEEFGEDRRGGLLRGVHYDSGPEPEMGQSGSQCQVYSKKSPQVETSIWDMTVTNSNNLIPNGNPAFTSLPWLMFHAGAFVELSGTGYIVIQFEDEGHHRPESQGVEHNPPIFEGDITYIGDLPIDSPTAPRSIAHHWPDSTYAHKIYCVAGKAKMTNMNGAHSVKRRWYNIMATPATKACATRGPSGNVIYNPTSFAGGPTNQSIADKCKGL